IRKQLKKAENKTKKEIAKQRKEEAKRVAEEEKKLKTMSKAEFDKLHGSKTTKVAKTRSPKIEKINAEGIKEGVLGGSKNNKKGGAGGKALTAEEGAALERYFSLFKQRLKQNFEPPPGLSEYLVAVVRVQ